LKKILFNICSINDVTSYKKTLIIMKPFFITALISLLFITYAQAQEDENSGMADTASQATV
jgi:hypothetical protein